MKKSVLSSIFLCFCVLFSANANDTVRIRETRIPVLIERKDNVLFYFRVDASAGQHLNDVRLNIHGNMELSDIQAVKVYYGGTRRLEPNEKNILAPVEYISSHKVGKTLEANPSYSVLKSVVNEPGSEVVLNVGQELVEGANFFWISLQMKSDASLLDKVKVKIEEITVDSRRAELVYLSAQDVEHRMGVGVRHAGDDGSEAFRIPGLVTTNNGVLLGVYDVRYNNSADLQEHIDIGLSRSLDGGRTWESMQLPLSFGETGGLPSAQNGVGDPSILVDTRTNAVWIVAAWTHGIGGQRAFTSSGQGMDMNHTAQLVMVKSEDEGKTWSEYYNITEQVKKPEWYFLFQGPGRGITMDDGTLVFPIQYIDENQIPNAGIMYSKDRGKNWNIHQYARTNTTESQVVEVEPGVLMLNMRDNRGGSRAVSTTADLGRTWTEHSSSRSALQEPVCMASLIGVKAEDNVIGKDILLFSNPNTTKGRHHITIKASLDGGVSWLPEHQVLLDEENGWGYSCLSMIDRETVGILYESSVAHITFQAIPLKDIIP